MNEVASITGKKTSNEWFNQIKYSNDMFFPKLKMVKCDGILCNSDGHIDHLSFAGQVVSEYPVWEGSGTTLGICMTVRLDILFLFFETFIPRKHGFPHTQCLPTDFHFSSICRHLDLLSIDLYSR